MRASYTPKALENKEVSTVGDIAICRKPLVLSQFDNIKDVLPRLRSADISAAGVVDSNGKIIGILTEKDILRSVFDIVARDTQKASAQIHDLDALQVQNVMVVNPKKLFGHFDIEAALEIMVGYGFRYMPVVNKSDERFLGVVDERELALHVKYRLEKLKDEIVKKDSLLSYFVSEPYGRGFTEAPSS